MKMTRIISYLSLAILLFASNNSIAQDTLTIGTGTSSSSTRGPFQRADTNSSTVFSRWVQVYTAAELAAAGITSGSSITEFQWELASSNTIIGTGNATLDIYVKNSTATAATSDTWANLTSGSTQAYTGVFNTTNNFPGANGWMPFVLSAPFVYTGGALEVAVDWDCSNVSTPAFNGNGALKFRWQSTSPDDLVAKKTASSGAPSTISDLKDERANIQIVYTSPTPAIASYPHTEGFEGGTFPPTNWSLDVISGSTTWTGNNGNSNSSVSARTGSTNAFLYLASTSGASVRLVTPSFDLTGLTSPELVFWNTQVAWGADQDTLGVYYKTSASGAWTYLTSFNTNITSWNEVKMTLPNPSADYYIAFEGYATWGRGVTIDDFMIRELPSCTSPSALINGISTATSSAISWTENGTATSWEVEWDTAGYTVGAGTNSAIVNTTSATTLTGLTAETDYEWHVRAICAIGDTSGWAGPSSFTTPCAAFVAPFLEDFTSFVPNCWDEATSGDITTGPTGLGSGNWGSSSGAVRVNLYTTTTHDWIVSPTVDLSAGGLELAIDARVYAFSGGGASAMGSDDTVHVVISTDGGATWASIYSWNTGNVPSTTLNTYRIDLSSYTGSNNIIGLYADEGTVNDPEDYYFEIDNFEVRVPPLCPTPSNLSTNSLAADSAVVAWVESGTATQWQVEWDTAGTTLGNSNFILVSTDTFTTISSLIAESTYDWRVRAICAIGDTSAWSSTNTFTTPCATVIAPFFDGFENHATLSGLNGTYNCWEATRQNTSNDWNIDASGSTPSSSTGPSGPYAGSKYMFFEASGGSAGAEATFTSPNIDVSGLTLPMIEFYYHMFGDNRGGCGNLYIDVIDGSVTTTVDSLINEQHTSMTDPWKRRQIFLPSATGSIKVVIRGTRGSLSQYGDISVDDFAVKEAPTCPDPSNPTASNSTSNSIDLAWTENGSASAWIIEYGAPGFTPGSGTVVSASSNPYTLTGLSNYTSYDYVVRSVCAVGDSSAYSSAGAFYVGLPMAGVYTIDSASVAANNFVSFSDLAAIINGVGVSGAVTINVAPGTYNDQFSLGVIPGSSATNTITIDGGSAATTTLTHDKSIRNSTFTIQGTSYLTVQNMTVAVTGGADSWGIHVWSGAHHITIDNNIVTMPVGTTGDVAGIVITGTETSDNSTADVDDLTISNNTVTGGERGINVYGNFTASSRSQNLTIHNNNVQNADDNGFYITGYNNVTITDNYVDGLTNSFSDGMYSSDLENFTITGNRFKGGDNGLEANDYNFDNAATGRSIIANNMLIGGDDGLYLDDCEDIDIFHNSTSGADWGVYINDDSNLDIRNNVFTSNGGDYAFNSLDVSTTMTLDYNLYFTSGATLARFGTTNYADLAAFQAGQATYNMNSVSGDPAFFNPTANLHATGATPNDVGDNTVGILVDIDGDTRPLAPSTTVDMGADEYTPPSCLLPAGLTSSNVTATSVLATWTEAGSATQWEVEYGASGYTPGSGTSIIVNVDTFTTITGLTPQTAYDWNVRAICGPGVLDTSSWSGPSSFSTLCVAFTAPFNENFDGLALTSPYTALPSCWTPQAGPDFWDVTNGSTNSAFYLTQPADHTTGSGNYMWIDASSDILGNAMETPLVDMSGLTTPYAGFWFASNNTNNAVNHTINLDVWDGAAWLNIATQSGNFTGWVEVAGIVPATVPSTTQFRIQAIAATGTTASTYYFNDLGVDDFFVKEAPVKAPISLPITWDDGATVDLTTIDFGGNASMLTADPANAANTVLQSIKGANSQVWAGTSFGDSLATAIPFSAGTTTIRAVVYSPTSGTPVRLKVEDHTNPGISVETEVMTTVANAWDTLSFDMSMNASGTAAINFANTYDKMSIFYNFGNNPATADTFYVDLVEDVSMNAVPPLPAKAAIALPITWDDTANVNYTVIDFGGNASSQAVDPTNANNLVLQSIKGAGAQVWAGTSFGDSLATAIPFSAGNTTIRAVVYSPLAGVEIRLKVEDQTNGAISVESVDTTTVVNGWDTLNFDMSMNFAGTPAINFANTYDKMSIFYNFGVMPAVADTFYVDYVSFENPPPAPAVDPYYPIAILNTEDANGVADSIGVTAFTSGTVVGIDLDGNNGISFTIVDMSSGSQEGMNIFNFNDVSNYVVTEGDSIMVHGSILQFRGLTELSPDSISIISTGNAIPAPIVVTDLDETTESKWLSIPTSYLVLNASGTGSSNVSLTNGTDTITMRIDADTDINDSLNAGMGLLPGDTICGLLGTGGQFNSSTSAPFLDGYQIFPMRWSDLTICKLAIGIDDVENASSSFSISPNPTNGQFEIRTSGFNNSIVTITVRDMSGRIVSNQNISNATNAFNKSFDLEGSAKGMYIISIQDGENVINEKLIIQ